MTVLPQFGVRLREERLRKGLDQREMAGLLGVSRNSQQAYEAGKTAAAVDYLLAAQNSGLDVAYLLTGKRKPQPQPPDKDGTSEATVELVEVDLAYGLGGSFADDLPDRVTHLFPRAWLEGITRSPPSTLFFARGRGDSMSPTIADGDMVLIDRSQQQVREQDAIWALTVGEIAQIKRLRVLKGGVELHSDNPLVSPYAAADDEVNVVGRVIFIGRRI